MLHTIDCPIKYARGFIVLYFAGIISCMRPANERRRYIVTSSLIGWAHTQISPWFCFGYVIVLDGFVWIIEAYSIIMTSQWARWRLKSPASPLFLLSSLIGLRSKKTSTLRVPGLCAGNSPGTGKFSAQMASNAENVSIWWRHHAFRFPRWHWGNRMIVPVPVK